MFNFWKKKHVNENLAKIEFSIVHENEKPKLNIEILGYDDISIKALCDILEVFQGDRFIVEILNFIQGHFLENGKDEELIKMFVILQEKSLLQFDNKEKKKEPYIKPSDMMG